MNYTQNYQLPQWAETDRILMEDFNDSYSKLDAALSDLREDVDANTAGVSANTAGLAAKGNCQLYTASYVGTGSLSVSLTFPGQPYFLMVIGNNCCVWGIRGTSQGMSRHALGAETT